MSNSSVVVKSRASVYLRILESRFRVLLNIHLNTKQINSSEIVEIGSIIVPLPAHDFARPSKRRLGFFILQVHP